MVLAEKLVLFSLISLVFCLLRTLSDASASFTALQEEIGLHMHIIAFFFSVHSFRSKYTLEAANQGSPVSEILRLTELRRVVKSQLLLSPQVLFYTCFILTVLYAISSPE